MVSFNFIRKKKKEKKKEPDATANLPTGNNDSSIPQGGAHSGYPGTGAQSFYPDNNKVDFNPEGKPGNKPAEDKISMKGNADIFTDLPEFPEVGVDQRIPLPDINLEEIPSESSALIENPNENYESSEKHEELNDKREDKEGYKKEPKIKSENASKDNLKLREGYSFNEMSDILYGVSKSDKVSENLKIKGNETFFSVPKSCFINIENYREIIKKIEIISAMVSDSIAVKDRLDEIKIHENRDIKELYNSLAGLNKIFITIDDILGRQEKG